MLLAFEIEVAVTSHLLRHLGDETLGHVSRTCDFLRISLQEKVENTYPFDEIGEIDGRREGEAGVALHLAQAV